MKSSFFVSGVPCTGKTWLGNWLFENEGFEHVDAEKNGGRDLDTVGIHHEWDSVASEGRADNLARKIAALPKPVVLNWGFPMSYLYFVRALQVAGIETWWIRADPQLARDAFISRGGINVACFDRQIGDINRNIALIELVFGTRIIDGLTTNGEQRHPSELWSEMNQK
ncbi:MAG: hypothetical protein ABIS50_05005 [Luteolibacter sp.]|uniref:hypothetical protein n=1 Tax=Luteolibacter sp. TaxID=1962973 RepID=UPI0032644413